MLFRHEGCVKQSEPNKRGTKMNKKQREGAAKYLSDISKRLCSYPRQIANLILYFRNAQQSAPADALTRAAEL
jgi:hypothetical protein